jgi:hypothetical protein
MATRPIRPFRDPSSSFPYAHTNRIQPHGIEVCDDAQMNSARPHPVLQTVRLHLLDTAQRDRKHHHLARDDQMTEGDIADVCALVPHHHSFERLEGQPAQPQLMVTGIAVDAVHKARAKGGVYLEQSPQDSVCQVGVQPMITRYRMSFVWS